MVSMRYCQFQNSRDDLEVGVDDLRCGVKTLSEEEESAAREIIDLAGELSQLLGLL